MAIDIKVNLKVKVAPGSDEEAAMNLFDTLTLPNGSTIANRIAKAAMEENMADADHAPAERLMRLYQAWTQVGQVPGDGHPVSGNV